MNQKYENFIKENQKETFDFDNCLMEYIQIPTTLPGLCSLLKRTFIFIRAFMNKYPNGDNFLKSIDPVWFDKNKEHVFF